MIVIDCNCGRHANLIDLYSDAFEVLASYRDEYGYHRGLDKGVLRVTLEWL